MRNKTRPSTMMSRTMKKFETATTTYVYDGLEGILGGYLVGGTQHNKHLLSRFFGPRDCWHRRGATSKEDLFSC
jgi:hypothetical protein